jgi:hypothetical protein
MKILTVTPEQFHTIWNRMLPANRMSGDVPTPAIVMPHLNTMLVLEGEVEFGSLGDIGESFTIASLAGHIQNAKLEGAKQAA